MDQTLADRAPSRRRRRRMLVAMLLASSLATVGAGAMSLAVFSDSRTVNGAWSTGTVILGVSPTTVFNPSGILPGDHGSADVTVSNTGTGDLRWAMTSSSATTPSTKNSATLDLAQQMTLSIVPGTCAVPTGPAIYTGTLKGALVGDPTQGAQAGDQAVAAGTSQALCFNWSLPQAFSDNNYQNVSDATTFTFAAEQTKNN